MEITIGPVTIGDLSVFRFLFGGQKVLISYETPPRNIPKTQATVILGRVYIGLPQKEPLVTINEVRFTDFKNLCHELELEDLNSYNYIGVVKRPTDSVTNKIPR